MSQLDQIVKGASLPDANLPYAVANTPSPPLSQPSSYLQDSSDTPASATPDPLSTLPSSPPQIYLNLLILESALRSQYLALRARKRQNTFFLLLLTLWIAYFSYALFLRPREDGRGVGGSVYWVVETGEKVALMGGVVTGILIWGTGQWEHGLRWPRRWLGVANRGLRGMNAKIVVMRGPWWKEILSYLSFIFPYSAFFPSNTSFRYVEREKPNGDRERYYRRRTLSHTNGRHPVDEESDTGIEEDLAPGGDYIRLLLLPKSFSPAFRENWDEYRSDYWEKENERRARLRLQVKQHDREQAKLEAGRLWWARWWKPEKIFSFLSRNGRDKEKQPHNETHHYRHHKSAHSRNILEKDPLLRSRRGGSSLSDSHTHSRTSSRSTTPIPFSDADDKMTGSDRERDHGRGGSRRTGSVTELGYERGRKSKPSLSPGSKAGGRLSSPLTQIERQNGDESSPSSNSSIKSHE